MSPLPLLSDFLFFLCSLTRCSEVTTLWRYTNLFIIIIIIAGWQVILCDPIWHVSSRSGEASCELLFSVYLYLTLTSGLL